MNLFVLGLLLSLQQLASGKIAPYPYPPSGDDWTFDGALKNFAVLAPSQYRPGLPYSVAVELLSKTAAASTSLAGVDARLACTANRVGYNAFALSAKWRASVADGTRNSILLTLEMVQPQPKQLDFTAQCKLSVSLKDTSGRQFSDTGDVTVSAVQSEIFVQTDKAIYKPGQLVKFRVVSLSEALLPVFKNFTVFVKDADGNLVDRYEHKPRPDSTASLSDALYSGQFQLSDQPNLGEWSLLVEAESVKETKTFTVDRYVLPKLEVRLDLPDFVHVNDTEFTVTAEPRYTYDKTADGVLTVNATLRYRCQDVRAMHRFAYQSCNFTLIGRRESPAAAAAASAAAAGPVELKFSLEEWRQHMARRGSTLASWGGITALVTAEFREKFSGVITRANQTLTVYKGVAYRLEIDTSAVDFVMPGMTVPVQLRLIRADGKPYRGPLPSGNISLTMSWQERGRRISKKLFDVMPDGSQVSWTVLASVPDTADFTQVEFQASCPGISGNYYRTVRAFQTRGASALRVELSRGDTGDLQVVIHAGNGIATAGRILCAIVSQEGVLAHWLVPDVSASSNTATVTLSAARVAELQPKFTILAVGFHGNELVATAKTYQPSASYDGVRLSSNVTKTASPRQPVRVSVGASPDSVVFLTGIDHSVNLMKSGQDISAGVIEQRLAENNNIAGGGVARFGRRSSWWHPTPNTASELKKSGLIALTDFNYIKERPLIMFSMRANAMEDDAPVMEAAKAGPALAMPGRRKSSAGAPRQSETSSGNKKNPVVQVRKFFPESFIWTWLRTDSNGTAEHTVTLPDTITSWDVTGFAINARQPIQAARTPLNIVSRRLFFIRPVLPYALVRGENFLLKVLLFNYAHEPLTVTVRLTPHASLRLLDASTDGYTREVKVPAGRSNVAVFSIAAIQMPAMKLSLRADGFVGADAFASDAVERRVRVDAEGAVRRRVATALLNLTTAAVAASGAPSTQRLPVQFPDKLAWLEGGKKQLVEDSEYARIQVTGTLMGASVSNLERLLRMPYGCGEQNMINFAPAVFVLDCLGPAEATADVVAKAVRIMKTGYQRELTYRRKDGSYSAFGNSDASGSTWLTAFVLSVYAQAAAFIPMDPEALSGASLNYLLAQQQPDGSFAEPGRVIHAEMQGAGASGKAGLTAYVCAALLRVARACRAKPELRSSRWRTAPDTAMSALRRGLRFVYDDYRARPADFLPSDLAVAAYAARLAVELDSETGGAIAASDAKVASFLWMQLYEASKSEGDDKRYWNGGGSGSSSGSAETTGYALLTALLRGDLETSVPTLRWLVSRQSDLGGFQSTQDTVVGLQAMARFVKAHPGGGGVGTVTVSWGGQSAQFGLGPKNRTLLQRREIGRGDAARGLSGGVSVSGVGSGVAMVTVAYSYNLRDAPDGWISNTWTVVGGVGLRLHSVDGVLGGFAPDGSAEVTVCAKADGGPGMYIVSLSNPSGFGVDAHSPVGGALARVEPEADRLVFYLSELTSEICLSARWVREVPVLKLNPQRFSVQNYYKPDQEISLFHMHPKLTGLTECKVCPECPKCRKPGTDL